MSTDPVSAVEAALARIDGAGWPEIWIHRPPAEEVLAAAEGVARRAAAGDDLPLLGAVAAVKGNIDVAGWPTTAGCPAFASVPRRSAAAVDRLRAAGAVVVGTTNMDQFATGLVGTRSPYGAVRNAHLPSMVSGGSSSGSAVAVALGLVDLALGTDTAGSGRVPAALNGIVGLKPTRGRVSTRGVVPACRSLDCVSVFTPTVAAAVAATAVLSGFDPDDPWSRRPQAPRPASVPARVGVPRGSDLEADPHLDGDNRAALAVAAGRLADTGHEVVEVSLDPFLAAGALLYGGAFVAERYAAVGAFISEHPDEVDPTVRSIIEAGAAVPAHQLAADQDRLRALAREAEATWEQIDVLLLPTIPTAFTQDEVAADPFGPNAVLGTYTTFVNLLDQCAVSVPTGVRKDGLPVGVSVVAPAWGDTLAASVAAHVTGEPTPVAAAPPEPGPIFLAVVGAHLTGQPLNHQLTQRSATLVATTTTSADYRLHALPTQPPKPGLVRVADGGGAIEVEVWQLEPAAFGDFVAQIPAPLGIGRVVLADGSDVAGFLCEPVALPGTEDITALGGWRAYVGSRS
jgi:allophanate hydrolase